MGELIKLNRLIVEFERQFLTDMLEQETHHEECFSAHNTFNQQVTALVEAIKELGNPFFDDTSELLVLDLRDIMNEFVVETVRTVESLGTEKYNRYYESVILKGEHSIHE